MDSHQADKISSILTVALHRRHHPRPAAVTATATPTRGAAAAELSAVYL